MADPRATVGIVSIGAMGVGVANILIGNGYRVVTTLVGRSPATFKRAESASITVLPSYTDLANEADYILSIVPPAKAIETAAAVIEGYNASNRAAAGDARPLHYLELNAISPSRVRSIETSFSTSAPSIVFIDGGIIGGPPTFKPTSENADPTDLTLWFRPSIPLSGPSQIPLQHLADVLNSQHIAPTVGSASGLKCTFASLTKGFTALAAQSVSTAAALGVLPQLQSHLDIYSPAVGKRVAGGLVGMRGKEARWVDEMREIGKCFSEEGGWGDANVFERIGDVYEVLSEVLDGNEERTFDGVVSGLRQGLDKGK